MKFRLALISQIPQSGRGLLFHRALRRNVKKMTPVPRKNRQIEAMILMWA
jgi:hypothetical protein